jgi:hypothetical protein
MSCAKTVIDFTNATRRSAAFFIQNQSQNICGRMKKSQLDSITIQIPSRVLYKTQYLKCFLLALFITMEPLCLVVPIKRKQTKKLMLLVVKDTKKNNCWNDVARKHCKTVQPPGPATKVNHVKFINPQTIACEETTKNEVSKM